MRVGNITASLAAIAVAVFASSATAQQFSLSSSSVTGGTASFSTTTANPATLSQTTTLDCKVSATLNVDSAGSNVADLTGESISAGSSFLCGLVVFPTGDWYAEATSTSSGTVDLLIGANTIANDPCYGRVTAGFSSGPGGTTIDLDNVTLQAASGRPDRVCTIDAILVSSTPVYIVP